LHGSMNEYDRLNILGRGSHGVARLLKRRHQHGSCARDEKEFCVAKEIDLSAMPGDAQQETQNEVMILKSLSHVNIVKYYDTFVEDEILYIVMEYADAGDLSKVIRDRKSEGFNFQELGVLSVLLQCGRALRHIHARRIVHRDLKSENVFLASGVSDGCTVKIGDFGTSKMLEHTRAMATTLIGTPSHLSPEVCDNMPYGSKADIWSLGVVLYELLTLEPPFKATNLAALVLKIVISEPKPVPIEYYSVEVRGFIKPMLEKDPVRRPSAAQLLREKALRHVARLSPLPSLTERPGPASPSEVDTLTPTPESLSEASEAERVAGQAKNSGSGSPEILRQREREAYCRQPIMGCQALQRRDCRRLLRRQPPALDSSFEHLDQGQHGKLHQLSPAALQQLQLPALEPSSMPPTPNGTGGDCKNRHALSVGAPRRRTLLHPLDCQPQVASFQALPDRMSVSPSPGRRNVAMRALGSCCNSQPPSVASSPVGEHRCMTLPEVLRSSPQEAETSGTRTILRPRPKSSAPQEVLVQHEKDEALNLPRLLGRPRGPEVVVGGKDKI